MAAPQPRSLFNLGLVATPSLPTGGLSLQGAPPLGSSRSQSRSPTPPTGRDVHVTSLRVSMEIEPGMTHLHEGKEPFGAFWTLRVRFQASCPRQNAGEGAGLHVGPPPPNIHCPC